MFRLLALTLLLSGCAATPSVHASDTERLLVEVPEGWLKVVDRKVGSLHMAEYYPAKVLENQAEDWQQKLSIEALSGSDLPDPLLYVEGLAEEQEKVCNKFTDNSVFAGFENGYPTVVHMLECGESQVTGRAVVTMLKIIQGNESLYTVSRIWRLPPPAPPMASDTIAIDQAELGAWSQALRKVTVCDPSLAAHPCPEDSSG